LKNPTVSFVVPCYKLAHLLRECVDSILAQTFADFEVLIMDDCSPDNTAEVAQSFTDPRVRHIRNEPNLGHLRNYNKGIDLSRGEYVWLISADDRIRRPYALERYVALMEKNPGVGYAFGSGIGLHDGEETTLLDHYYYGETDRVFNGRDFIATLLRRNSGILSPSVMVRRCCYEEISLFPLDMPHEGDLYIWLAWALEHDVAYFAEPMVNYRTHDLSMMKDFLTQKQDQAFADDVNVMWRVKHKAEDQGLAALSPLFESALASKYSNSAAVLLYGETSAAFGTSVADCKAAFHRHARNAQEEQQLLGRFSGFMGDKHWWHGNYDQARRSYLDALSLHWYLPKVWVKLLVAVFGRTGFIYLKEARTRIRQRRISFG
jgi:glycosyltransferase involved in cell wall biosynthesis